MTGRQVLDQSLHLGTVEQVDAVPGHSLIYFDAPPGDGMNVEARLHQRRDRRSPDKSARSRQQNAGHHGKVSASASRGLVRSAGDRIGPGNGQEIASAGSSKAMPR